MKIYTGYHPNYRMFGFFRDIKVHFGGELRVVHSELMHSIGCKLSSCFYDGFCKDCPYGIKDMFTI